MSDILSIGYMLAAAPDIPATNLREFIALLKNDPTRYSYGSSGISTALHLMGEMFNKEAGVTSLHVPYKGGNQVQLDLMSSRISFAFLPTGAMDAVKAGKLKTFGFASDRRDPDYPNLPTLDEGGLKNFKVSVGFYLLAPKATPPGIVSQLNGAANSIVKSEAFYARVKSLGGVKISAVGSSAEIQQRMMADQARWDRLIQDANIKLE
ncbi:Bug family tripartite tricarboxylate transporter substrate binding protein [Acidovorax sp. SDU_ACID1]|uniref:Bug family tripartite tricarboxylate transporter substrate binding protein n=1 Tax=Acidovorax sp. SDU_ACID1 TaxID=3136632 RepID=UPI0038738721